MRQRVILHIGAPKTGTSYLQKMWWRNRRALAAAGIHLPGRSQGDHFQAGRDVLERPRPRRHPSPPWDGALDDLIDDIRAAGAPTSIISDEQLASATRPQAERTFTRLEGFDVDVGYGVRDMPGLLTSGWQESVKHGSPLDDREWLASVRSRAPDVAFWRFHDVPAVLERWRPPTGRMFVVTVPGPGAAGDALWARWQQVIGATVTRPSRVGRANESMGYVEARLVASLQGHLPDRAPRARVRDVVSGFLAPQVLARRAERLPILLPPSERSWVEQETRRRDEAITSAGVRLVGDVTDVALRSDRFGGVSLDGAEDVVHGLAHDVVAALLARGERQEATLRRRRAQAGSGGTASAAWEAGRDVANYGLSTSKRRQYQRRSRKMLEERSIDWTDPEGALDAVGKVAAELVLSQARRSIELDELDTTGGDSRAIVRRVARLRRT